MGKQRTRQVAASAKYLRWEQAYVFEGKKEGASRESDRRYRGDKEAEDVGWRVLMVQGKEVLMIKLGLGFYSILFYSILLFHPIPSHSIPALGAMGLLQRWCRDASASRQRFSTQASFRGFKIKSNF